MKTFEQLTETQKSEAKEITLSNLLTDIIEHGIRFNDRLNGDNLQARIDAAGQKAEDMQTPWFWAEYILDTCREELEEMAYCQAEDALYHGGYDTVIELKTLR